MTKSEQRKQIGRRLRIAREYLGMSQEKVGKAVQYSGPQIGLIELGRRTLATEVLVRLAKLYGRPVSYFTDEQYEFVWEPPKRLKEKLQELTPHDLDEIVKFAEFLKHRRESR